jgi:hypothetical protein
MGRRLVPRTFQARLTIAFVGVVALTLGLVAIFILNRLDDYFTQQQNAEVTARAKLVAAFIDSRVGIALEGQPAVVDGRLNSKATTELRKQIVGIANFLAQADVDVNLWDEGRAGHRARQGGHFAAGVTVPPPTGTRELFSRSSCRRPAASQPSSGSASNPYTVRQTTLANADPLAAVGVVALGPR